MAKISGLGMSLTCEDSGGVARDISEDVMTFTSNQSRALIDVTGLDKEAFERLGGLKDFEFQFSGSFDPGSNKSHDVFNDLDNLREVVLEYPSAVATLTITVALESYNVSRGNDGALTWTVTARTADGTVGVWS